MLSAENPPPDPSEISQLNSNICGDERYSDNNQHQVEEVEVVDLFNPGLDDDNNSLPKFSIRDYVFSTREKDIENHWPFSSKNLQLCLKHGVKDVLPPFHTIQSVRNDSSTLKCAAESTSNFVAKLSALSDHLLQVSSNNVGQKLALDIEKTKSSSRGEDKEHPSTTTSLSCSNVYSVPLMQSSCLEPEAENLPVEKPEFVVPSSSKVEIKIRKPMKKCRLVVKLSNVADRLKSNEELSVNTSSMMSETIMASKVCPVCKTFTSSSNTTLNAHIDQCLSGESNIKWTENPKVIKHRIKPRKTRMMVDIYATSLPSTLEDLDRRNGTNWASNLGFPARDLEVYAEEKNKTYSSVHTSTEENNNNEGAVYYDSNGKKLRILSKFSDLQSNLNVEDDCGGREQSKLNVKRDQGSKFASGNKNKYVVQRHKLLNSLPHGQRRCSSRLNHCPQVENSQERGEDEDLAEPLKDCNQQKSTEFGMIKQWVGSKRTGLKKKINLEHESQHPDIFIRKNLSDKFIKRTGDCLSDDDPTLASESHTSKEDLSLDSSDEYMEQRFLKKRPRVSLLESRDSHGKKNHLVLSKCHVKQSKKDGPSFHKRCDLPSVTENHAASRRNKKMRIISPTINSDSSFIRSRMSKHHIFSSGSKEFGSSKKSSLAHVPISGGKKLSSLTKNLLSVRHTSASESKKNLRRKQLDFKKPRLHYTSGSDEEEEDRCATNRQDNLVETLGHENADQKEKDSDRSLIDRARILKKKRRGFLNSGMEGEIASKCSDDSPESGNVPFCTSTVPDTAKEVEIQEEFVSEPISKISGGEAFTTFGKSFDAGLPALTGPDAEFISQHYMKAYEGHHPADKVGKDLVTSDIHVVAEKKANEGQGNYFDEVDPIPIPGPPGSYLPSPGRMTSDELQGNSSLTTCRMHSSEDLEHEFIDMDSSDSIASRSDSVSFVNLTVQSDGVHESQRDMSQCRMDHVFGQVVTNSQMGCAAALISRSSKAKFTTCGDHEPSSPSTSNPILRLMGKNLMVLNKEENLSPQTRPTQSSTVNGVVSSGNIQIEHRSSHHTLFQTPSIIDNTQTFSPVQHFDFTSYDGSLGYDSRHVNLFYGYQTRCYPTQMVKDANTQVPPSKGKNENFVDWKRAPEGSNVLHPNSLTASSPSTGHLRSSMYFSPGFSLHRNFT